MHGLGNDFMVVDAVSQRIHFRADQIRRLSDRHTGIGFDQLLIVEPPSKPHMDFAYRIYNADGNEVEHCGNGARCFARFVQDRRLICNNTIHVETNNGDIVLRVQQDGQVQVDMGVPSLNPEDLPYVATARQNSYPLNLDDGLRLDIAAVSVGNPHAVTLVDDVFKTDVANLGPAITEHSDFPARVNAGFLQVINRGEARLRVHERGVGETLACGTGACAAMVAGRILGHFDDHVRMRLCGGDLQLQWPGEGKNLIMTGPATLVYEGQIRL